MNTKRASAFFVDFIIASCINVIPFSLLVMYPVISKNPPSNIIFRTLLSSLIAFIYLILRDLPSKRIGDKLAKTDVVEIV